MDWITTLVAAICSLIGALSGGGILYLRYNREIKRHEAELKEVEVEHNTSDNWREYADRITQDNKEKDSKIDQLACKVDTLSDTVRGLKDEVARLTQERCTRLGCMDREPPLRKRYQKEKAKEKDNE